jgi:hypothetical protein
MPGVGDDGERSVELADLAGQRRIAPGQRGEGCGEGGWRAPIVRREALQIGHHALGRGAGADERPPDEELPDRLGVAQRSRSGELRRRELGVEQ